MLTRNDHYNDRFLFVTIEDLFRPVIQRKDFAAQIASLLDDTNFNKDLSSLVVAGSKGTDNVACGKADLANQNFCNNWKEMLLLIALPTPTPITIDGAATPPCQRVLIFAGQKTTTQVRNSASDKSDPSNYLEGANLAAFATPTLWASNFVGASTFDWKRPAADLMRCLP